MRTEVLRKSFVVALLGVVAAALLFMSTSSKPESASGASPGATIAPLLSCPNVDGSADNKVAVGDILAVVQSFFKDYPSTDYVFMHDLAGPYNPETGAGGVQRVDDILSVVGKFFNTCPVVDTEVAQAVRWAIDTNPGMAGNQPIPQIENEAALESFGYYRGTTDVPGQGVHYINLGNWDGTFDPKAPEGLVYNNGRLAAQLYVADGNAVGLGTHTPGPCNPGCPGKIAGVELETAGDGPQCNPKCSWTGAETWHLHYYLCTYGIGTTGAIAIPGSFAPGVGDTQQHCQQYAATQGSGTQCTIPVTTQPCWMWDSISGWMGHLYAWYPNANRIPDVNGTMNGRFADCFPDTEGWKSTNCPG